MALEIQALPAITFGPGCLAGLGAALQPFGPRTLLVRGSSRERAEPVRAALRSAGIDWDELIIRHEPTVAEIVAAVEALRSAKPNSLIGFGGGSVIDAAKAVAGLLANPGDPFDYLEVVGRALPLPLPAVPWVAVPTTAGTGAEVTRNAVLSVPERRVKVSLRSPHLLARSVWLDPDLLLGLPPAVRAATGMDALTQLIEAYVCCRASAASDVWCEAGIARVARALPRWAQGDDGIALREAMAWGALWSGAALAQAGLGAVHGLAGPLGGVIQAPHGAVCAALLPGVMEANLRALPTEHPATARYAQVARWLTGRADAAPADGVAWVRSWVTTLGIPPLSHWGLRPASIGEIAAQAVRASSMKANPVVLPLPILEALLAEAG